ncbi:MAG: putative sulfate exporter family transporter [Deferribacterales bacterium]
MSLNSIKIIYWFFFLLSFTPVVTSPTALVIGVLLALLFNNPYQKESASLSKTFLKIAIIGLGFGVDIIQVIHVGKNSILLTFISISLTLLLGIFLGRIMGVNRKTSTLISFGTSICGGSAIAAMAPVIKAEMEDIAVSLATVFLLNASALVIFPNIGHLLNLDQTQFGLWSAIAIHDTSSVVGATAVYGALALSVGTTVKLTRALWIAPFTLCISFITKNKAKNSFPLFIIGFLVTAFINSYFSGGKIIWHNIALVSKHILVATLFLIGTGLTKEALRRVGLKPMIQGILLWVVVSSVTLILVKFHMINIIMN